MVRQRWIWALILLTAPLFAEECCSGSEVCQNECDQACCLTYTPWEMGSDPGLYCLPASRCCQSYCSQPTGAALYRPWSNFDHPHRFPSEYAPQEWQTIMLHMRYLSPMPAVVYRKITRWLMGVEAPCTNQCEKPSSTPKTPNYIDPPQNQGEPASDLLLAETLETPEVAFQDEIVFKTDDTLPFFSHPLINTLFCGGVTLSYQTRTLTGVGYDGNDSFNVVMVPYWVARYADSFLAVFKPLIQISGQTTSFNLVQAHFSYFYNDWITFTFGLFTTPLGEFYNWWVSSWINKLANMPLIRESSAIFRTFPISTLGADVRGAIPLCLPCLPSSFFTYDFWVGNGVPQATFAPLAFPIATSVPDNNNTKAWGARFALWPNYCSEVGVSGMRSQWNTTPFTPPLPNKKLYYSALGLDWNIHLGEYALFRGEWLWSQYENGFAGFNTTRGYWIELSSMVSQLISRPFPKFYCETKCFWDSTELVVRLERLRTNFTNDSQDRCAFGFNYYFTTTALFKFEYDLNYHGNFGFNRNQISVSLSYEW